MDEAALVKLVKQGDEDAFRILISKYKPVVERFAYQFGLHPEVVGDVTQEVFIKIHRSIHSFYGGVFTTWLYQITLNATRDYYRKNKREREKWKKLVLQHPTKVQNQVMMSGENELLHQCIGQLKVNYRIAIILYYFHDKSYEEIARITKANLSTVKTRIRRAKEQLKKLYEEREEDHANE
ncbi:RNA polymerase sigma factor [Radiobacillus sp. PE A8.2]|uniref:RNA polymerase sigma factor n=1 Tax=Radiobacillus sp. PE A8.2 TaxID=3380349 RepID=UPI003890DD51